MEFKIVILISMLLNSVQVFGQQFPGHHPSPPHSCNSDKAALLAFKRGISSDPYSRLGNWNEETDLCNFTCLKCGKLHHRVVQINLNNSALLGSLSPLLSNLTQLRHLDLANNHFFGNIPSEYSSLRNLILLKLSTNNLQGEIPGTFHFLSNLKLIHLTENNLRGKIPPTFFFNCTLLRNVDFSRNGLTGTIPSEIGNCPKLWNLELYNNQLTGEIPISLGNATGMLSLDVENNSISGELPFEIVSKFQNIRFLHLSDTHLVSHDSNTNLEPFFTALSNCSELLELELAGMGLGGNLSSAIGRMSTNLETLQLQENRIFGPVPPEIGILSGLTLLNLTSNLLTGAISSQIYKLTSLQQLCLSFNFFIGSIPDILGCLSYLGLMDLPHNNLSGPTPEEIGNLAAINFLFLNNNFLTGKIPSSIGRCTALQALDLSFNSLTGKVPSEITGLQEMRRFLNLAHNQLEGPLPIELSKLASVEEIDLSWNNFNGSIFYQISSCYGLKVINFAHNSLQGHLPDSLGDLKSLESFDVSRNKLSGTIPTSLNKSSTLNLLNLSYNDLSGTIPTGGVFDSLTISSFLGSQHLCGLVPGIPTCNKKWRFFHSHRFLIIICIVIFISGFITTVCCVIGYQRFRVISSFSQAPGKKKTPELTHNFPIITYKELLEATEGFDDSCLVGSGSYGHVYRGTLPDGIHIPVKVLHLQTGNSTKSFNRECQVLKRIRHRNLIRIITACSLPDFKALVLPYMANGSLDSRLYPHVENGIRTGSSGLNLVQRVNICSDIAEGMAYLHHHSPVKVIHCDLKPSNVLLNEDMTALVSDFGISWLVMNMGATNGGVNDNVGNSTANMLHGSIGYIAPEYGFGSSPSTKGDVYSFGVLVLEMVTRKRPTDEMFAWGLNLHKYVKNHYHTQMENVIDHSLVRTLRDQSPELNRMSEVAIRELIELGIFCTHESLFARPTMLDCADDLDRLKRYLSGDTTVTFSSSLGISSSALSDN